MRLALCLALAAACATGCQALEPRARSPYDIGFRGPGRLAVVWETETPAGDLERALVVYDAGGARELPVADALDVRWLSPDELLVGADAPPARDGELPRIALLRVDAGSGAARPFGAPALYFDPEPSPDGRWLAVGVQVDEQGGSEFELWSLSDPSAPVVERAEALDEPRWSPQGAELVVTATIEDPDGESGEHSLSVEGVGIGWPRLFRVRRDLTGAMQLLHDGEPGKEAEPGGSIPLWWDARGIFARQRRGLVRCDPAGSGCALAYDPGEHKRVLGGRARGAQALLLVVDTTARSGGRIANELHRVDLDAGSGEVLFRATGSRFPIELDWGE
jgi:hypothetical protein